MNYLISISWHILPIFTIEQVLEKIEKYDKTHKIAGIEYLSNVGKLAKILNKKINIVFHSKEDDNLKIAKLNTINLLNTIFNYIKENNLNISISLENLNYHHNHDRINVDKIDSILSEFDDVNFTYDIGHDIFDNHTE